MAERYLLLTSTLVTFSSSLCIASVLQTSKFLFFEQDFIDSQTCLSEESLRTLRLCDFARNLSRPVLGFSQSRKVAKFTKTPSSD